VGVRSRALLLTFGLLIVTLVIGWLVWSVVEWWSGRTPAYRLTRLRVVRRSDGRAIGLGRSVAREVCCLLLLIPTLVVSAFIALGFAMGASPPDGVLGQSRDAPWDVLTRTRVVNEPAVGASDARANVS
jgi:hypothetical protein